MYHSPLEKYFISAWAIWTYRNYFSKSEAKPPYGDMRYYKSVSDLFDQDSNAGNYIKPVKTFQSKINWNPSPNSWIKFNIDAFRKCVTRFTTIGVVGKDTLGDTVVAERKQIEDCSILVAECLTIREALKMTIVKNHQQIIIENDSTVNVIQCKIVAPRDITKLVKDIQNMRNHFKEISIRIVIEFVIARQSEARSAHS